MKKNNHETHRTLKKKDFAEITRRHFLSCSGAFLILPVISGIWHKSAIAAAVSEALPQFTALRSATNGILTGAHWGAFEAIISDSKMENVLPVKDDPHPNELITMAPHQLYAENRVKYPMVRKNWLNGGPTDNRPELRGHDEWIRITWEQAYTLVANEIQRLQKKYGPQSIYAGSYGWKSVGMLHNARTLLQRLMNLSGGFLGYAGDYSTGAAQIIMPYVVGSVEVYEQQTAWPDVIDNSELIVLWGCNPVVTLKNSWNLPDHVGPVGFDALKKKGTRIISIDPVNTESARHLGAEWISPRPYTDCAMMLGIAYTLLDEKLHDTSFLQKYTVGFEKFETYLTGQNDGVIKNADWAASLCEVDPGIIKKLARDMATHRTMIMGGWGIQRQHHGEQLHWMLVTLASMLGQIGLPGGGFGFSYHYSSGGSPTARGGILAGISAGQPTSAAGRAVPPIPVARISDCLLNPGHSIDFNGTRVTYPDVKMVYVAGGNTFQQQQDINKLIKAWQHPETIVVNEPYWTATAKYADIVLPVTTTYERNDMDMGGDYSQLYVFPLRQCVPPQYESKNDFDIFAGIAEKLGLKDKFTEGKDEMLWLKDMYDSMKQQARIARVALPPFNMFWESNNYIRFPVPEINKKWVRFADFRKNPLLNPLGTPSGKIEIFSETVAKMKYDDCKGIPTWMPPHEWYQGPEAVKYPLSLNTSHPVNRLHSQLDNTPLRLKYAVSDREAIWINPNDAIARGIKDKDLVRAYNDRGQILVGAVVTDNVRQGVVRISEGAWFDPADSKTQGSLCKNGSVNCLTFDIGSSSLSQGNCGHMTQLQIEKYHGPEMKNTAHTIPAGA
ncbi:trimethylamine-N-oxide reductase TorA [Citrobacter sedlakii]|uniref:trimethylamine-N-oxide reductase TorA n=1 Tax=Citrobacter sedlakii TaxID=67826 RepID=UPI0022B2E9F1|nr:trimethylamine-N-oxide reductase TorA [Citrobacter sedlakii]MCZ4677023.1 trimethylamine-N-oxide reductase TorA [Citrobacter sedlakii]MDR5007080.1 trimethylamine-N-oxide reductase TorA [Citrobacter sedlakii]